MMTQEQVNNVLAHRPEEVPLQGCICAVIVFQELSTVGIQL